MTPLARWVQGEWLTRRTAEGFRALLRPVSRSVRQPFHHSDGQERHDCCSPRGMHPFPHRYQVGSTVGPEGDVVLLSDGLPTLRTATPPEFDGPGGKWSPETLLVAAVVDCFVLTFRGIARGSKMPWVSLDVDCVGTLERLDRVTRFTRFDLRARIVIPDGGSEDQARRLLTRAEETCLITRSLTGAAHLEIAIVGQHQSTALDAAQPA